MLFSIVADCGPRSIHARFEPRTSEELRQGDEGFDCHLDLDISNGPRASQTCSAYRVAFKPPEKCSASDTLKLRIRARL